MRICFFRHSLLSRGGDKMIALHASYLAKQGHDVTIRTNVVNTVFPLHPGVKVEKHRLSGKLGTLLTACTQKDHADVVVADIIPLAGLLFLPNRGNVVYFAQDYDESYYSSLLQRLFIRFLYFLGLTLCKIPAVAVSEELASLLKRRFAASVEVVCNGVDTSIFFPEPSPQLLAQKAERKAVLVLSRKDFRKGFDLACDTISRFPAAEAAGFEVWTVGESATGSFPGVRHRDFGYVDEDSLRKIMSSADVFLYPSRHEGFPLMVAEAFACGCPVVTTHAVPYALHRKNALVGAVGDAEGLRNLLSELLDDAALRRSLAAAGSRFAGTCTLSGSNERFADALSRSYERRFSQ